MSCPSAVKRRRILLPGRSTAFVPGTGINTFVGNVSDVQNFKEINLFLNSKNLKFEDNAFKVSLPVFPSFWLNSRHSAQIASFQTSDPFIVYVPENINISFTYDDGFTLLTLEIEIPKGTHMRNSDIFTKAYSTDGSKLILVYDEAKGKYYFNPDFYDGDLTMNFTEQGAKIYGITSTLQDYASYANVGFSTRSRNKTSTQLTYISDESFNPFFNVNVVQIRVNKICPTNFESIETEQNEIPNSKNSEILCLVPVLENFQKCNYVSNDEYYEIDFGNETTAFEFYFTDENGQEIDFKNVTWSATFRIRCDSYDKQAR